MKWPASCAYFNDQGENIKNYIGELPEDFDISELGGNINLEEHFDQNKPAEMSDEEAIEVKRILRWILQYDPSKRPSSASELLNDPWFAEQKND